MKLETRSFYFLTKQCHNFSAVNRAFETRNNDAFVWLYKVSLQISEILGFFHPVSKSLKLKLQREKTLLLPESWSVYLS